VPYLDNEAWVESLNQPVVKPWTAWNTPNNQIGGYVTQYAQITFATVRGAGHMVPQTRPVSTGAEKAPPPSRESLPTRVVLASLAASHRAGRRPRRLQLAHYGRAAGVRAAAAARVRAGGADSSSTRWLLLMAIARLCCCSLGAP